MMRGQAAEQIGSNNRRKGDEMTGTTSQDRTDAPRPPIDAVGRDRLNGGCDHTSPNCDVPIIVGDLRPPGDWGEPSGPAAILDKLRSSPRDYDQWLALAFWFRDHGRVAEAEAVWGFFPAV